MKFSCTINNRLITVLVFYDAPSQYDQQDTSVPAQYLDSYEEAGWWSDGQQNADNAEQRLDVVIDELQEVIYDTCHGLLIEIAGPLLQQRYHPSMTTAGLLLDTFYMLV